MEEEYQLKIIRYKSQMSNLKNPIIKKGLGLRFFRCPLNDKENDKNIYMNNILVISLILR